MSAIGLIIGLAMAGAVLNTLKDSLFLTNIQLPREAPAARPYRTSFGILLLAGGLWGLLIVFLLDAVSQ